MLYFLFSTYIILGFSWQSLLPLLISKAAELMQIPASAGVEGVSVVQTNEFPHAFPAQYARILLVQSTQQNGADARTMALKKLAKLLHFVTSAYVRDDAGRDRCFYVFSIVVTFYRVGVCSIDANTVHAAVTFQYCLVINFARSLTHSLTHSLTFVQEICVW